MLTRSCRGCPDGKTKMRQRRASAQTPLKRKRSPERRSVLRALRRQPVKRRDRRGGVKAASPNARAADAALPSAFDKNSTCARGRTLANSVSIREADASHGLFALKRKNHLALFERGQMVCVMKLRTLKPAVQEKVPNCFQKSGKLCFCQISTVNQPLLGERGPSRKCGPRKRGPHFPEAFKASAPATVAP